MLRTKRGRLLFFVAVIVILAGVLFVVWPEGSPVAVTANGRRIAVEKVTYGTHHSFTQGKWWVRLLKPIRGVRWAVQRGFSEVRITNDVPALMVWTRWEGAQRLNGGVAVEATVVDENGVESELVLSRWNALPVSLSGGPGPQDGFIAWLFSNFPRRARKVHLRVYDRDRQYAPTQAVEIAISNPARKRTPEWRGLGLPLVTTTNGTQFSLTGVQQVSNALWRFNFVVRTNGKPDYSWLAGGIVGASANGNTLSTLSNLDTTVATNLSFLLRGALWPEEPVWRFATEFFRTVDFKADELWRLTNIAIPTPALPVHFTTNLTAHGNRPAEFKLERASLGVPLRPRGVRRNANVYVRLEAPDLHVFLAEATDERGRQIQWEVDRGAPRLIYAFGLALPAGAQAVNLTFAIRKPTVVTFYVDERSFTRTGRR